MEDFDESDEIIREGEDGDTMYLLISGVVAVIAGPERKSVATLRSGDVFGEMALIGVARRPATVRVLEYCKCAVMSLSTFNTVLHQFPKERRFFAAVAEEQNMQKGVFKSEGPTQQLFGPADGCSRPASAACSRPRSASQMRRDLLTPGKVAPMSDDRLPTVSRTANQCLHKSAQFGGRNHYFLWQLSTYMELESFDKGFNLITQGEEGYRMYVLARGSVEVLVGPEEKCVAILDAGCVFGEFALLGDSNRTATIRALEAGEVYGISQRFFTAVLKKFPEERSHFAAVARERKQRAEEHNFSAVNVFLNKRHSCKSAEQYLPYGHLLREPRQGADSASSAGLRLSTMGQRLVRKMPRRACSAPRARIVSEQRLR